MTSIMAPWGSGVLGYPLGGDAFSGPGAYPMPGPMNGPPYPSMPAPARAAQPLQWPAFGNGMPSSPPMAGAYDVPYAQPMMPSSPMASYVQQPMMPNSPVASFVQPPMVTSPVASYVQPTSPMASYVPLMPYSQPLPYDYAPLGSGALQASYVPPSYGGPMYGSSYPLSSPAGYGSYPIGYSSGALGYSASYVPPAIGSGYLGGGYDSMYSPAMGYGSNYATPLALGSGYLGGTYGTAYPSLGYSASYVPPALGDLSYSSPYSTPLGGYSSSYISPPLAYPAFSASYVPGASSIGGYQDYTLPRASYLPPSAVSSTIGYYDQPSYYSYGGRQDALVGSYGSYGYPGSGYYNYGTSSFGTGYERLWGYSDEPYVQSYSQPVSTYMAPSRAGYFADPLPLTSQIYSSPMGTYAPTYSASYVEPVRAYAEPLSSFIMPTSLPSISSRPLAAAPAVSSFLNAPRPLSMAGPLTTYVEPPRPLASASIPVASYVEPLRPLASTAVPVASYVEPMMLPASPIPVSSYVEPPRSSAPISYIDRVPGSRPTPVSGLTRSTSYDVGYRGLPVSKPILGSSSACSGMVAPMLGSVGRTLDLEPRLVTNVISESQAARPVAIDTRPTAVTAAVAPLPVAESRPLTYAAGLLDVARPMADPNTIVHPPVPAPTYEAPVLSAQDPNTIVHPPVPAPTYTEAVASAATMIYNPVEAVTSPATMIYNPVPAQDPNTIVHPPVPAPTYTEVEAVPAVDPNTIVHAPVPAPTYTEAVTAPTTPVVPFAVPVSATARVPVQDPNTVVHPPVQAPTYTTEVTREASAPTAVEAATTLRQFAAKLNTGGPQPAPVKYTIPQPAVMQQPPVAGAVTAQPAPQMMVKVKVPMATVEKKTVPPPVVAPPTTAPVVVKREGALAASQPVTIKKVTAAGVPVPAETFADMTRKSIAEELGPRVQPAPTGATPGRSMFDLLDKNKDGVITRKEFAQAFAGTPDVIREVKTSEAQVPTWMIQEALPAPSAATPPAVVVTGGKRSIGGTAEAPLKMAAAKPQHRQASAARAERPEGAAAAAPKSKPTAKSSPTTSGTKATVRGGVRAKS